jgi:hypothetical protein
LTSSIQWKIKAPKAKIRQLLHVLDEMTAAANEQQTLFLLNKVVDLPENAYEAVETLKAVHRVQDKSSICNKAPVFGCRKIIQRIQEGEEEEFSDREEAEGCGFSQFSVNKREGRRSHGCRLDEASEATSGKNCERDHSFG